MKVPGAQAIGRAFAVLRCVAAAPEGMTAATAARSVKLPRSTTLRLLSALEAERLVALDPLSGRYRIGAGALELAGNYLSFQDVRRIALPFLWELAETGETVNLAIRDGTDVICIEQIESPQYVRVVNWIGRRLPMHVTAAGKAWLAFQPESVVETLLQQLADATGRLPAFTERTITNPAALRVELDRTRELGFAVAHGELEPWLTAVAVPVFSHDGSVPATVAVSGPSFRLPAEQVARLGALATTVGRRLSGALGAPGAETLAHGRSGLATEEESGRTANGHDHIVEQRLAIW